jgi:hypothetical protein
VWYVTIRPSLSRETSAKRCSTLALGRLDITLGAGERPRVCADEATLDDYAVLRLVQLLDDRARIGHRSLERLQVRTERLDPPDGSHARVGRLQLLGKRRYRSAEPAVVEILVEPDDKRSCTASAHRSPRPPRN